MMLRVVSWGLMCLLILVVLTCGAYLDETYRVW